MDKNFLCFAENLSHAKIPVVNRSTVGGMDTVKDKQKKDRQTDKQRIQPGTT